MTIALWPPAVCGEAPVAEPGVDGGAHPGGGGGGGCTAAGSAHSSPAAALAAFAVALLLVGARRRWSRSRGRAARGRRAIAVVLPLLLAAPGAAHAYVRMKTPPGVPEYLPSRCFSLEVHLDGFPGVEPAAVRAAVTAAARAWSTESNASSLTFA